VTGRWKKPQNNELHNLYSSPVIISMNESKTKLNWPESASEIPTEVSVGEVSANIFADRECHVGSVTDPYGSILGFLDRSRYFFFQVAPQLYSRG
jgi:hypothetical protein